MKVRDGFVSNSSSSSFVMVGVGVSDFKELKEILTKLGFDLSFLKKGEDESEDRDIFYDYFLYGGGDNCFDSQAKKLGLEEYELISEPDCFGYMVADVSSEDSYLDYNEIPLDDLKEVFEKLPDAKLITGTRAC